MTRTWLAPLLLLAACPHAHAPAALGDTPAGLLGTRVVKHVVEVVDDTAPEGWSPAHVEDVLSIAARPNGRLWIGVSLVQGNAHMCLLEGVADYAGGEIVYRSDDAANQEQDSNADPEAPCELRVRVSETDGLTLSVPDAAQEGCRWFCGARASLDGAVFPWRTTPGAHMPKVP